MELLQIKRKLWPLLPVDMEIKREVKRETELRHLVALPDQTHLLETAKWLVRAQDAGTDHGVSRAYSLSCLSSVRYAGWEPSYPETTGYIIPTMFALSEFWNEKEFADRAFEMAQWEIDIQMPSGAVMGSVVTAKPSPAVFNTGQVIFGWVAAAKRSDDPRFLEAALRAGDYLVSAQRSDGAWEEGNSRFAASNATTYNARVAWALIELGLFAKKEKYVLAGRHNIELALTKQQPNGWYADNCLNDPDRPLLHTIVYATRGILESGLLLDEPRYVAAATKALDALLGAQRPDGGLAGRFSQDWSPAVTWDCLTGDAQLAIAWLRLHGKSGGEKYREAARAAVEFVKRTQNLEHPNPGIRGGVKGSFPLGAEYGKHEMLNWAAKFFCDALLLLNDSRLAAEGVRG